MRYKNYLLKILYLLLPVIYILLCSCGSVKKSASSTAHTESKKEVLKSDSSSLVGADSIKTSKENTKDKTVTDSTYDTKTVTVEKITIIRDTIRIIERVVTKTEKGKKQTLKDVTNQKSDSLSTSKIDYKSKSTLATKDSAATTVTKITSVKKKRSFLPILLSLLGVGFIIYLGIRIRRRL